MILLAEKCIGASAVIEDGQALIGGMDITVCRNYFGSQISSFEMSIPPPPPRSPKQHPPADLSTTTTTTSLSSIDAVSSSQPQSPQPSQPEQRPFPGVFIRAPAILAAGPDVEILGTVVATPCHQAAVVLHELQTRVEAGEHVVQLRVVDSLERNTVETGGGGGIHYKTVVVVPPSSSSAPAASATTTRSHQHNDDNATAPDEQPPNGDNTPSTQQATTIKSSASSTVIRSPGAANGSNAREVICAARHKNILCTAFHPELTDDYRWHEYFVNEMVLKHS
ncbi:hypothetical protein ACA910_012058 [Epithemia clementina (nom. ined.)]